MTRKGEDWGPWVDHDGISCPNGILGFEIMLEERCVAVGVFYSGPALVDAEVMEGGSWCWSNYPIWTRILRYRIRKPRALRDLIRLAEDLPQKERIDA